MKRMLMMLGVVATALLGFAGAPKPEGGPYKETVDGIEWTFMVDADLMASVGDGSQGTAVAKTTSGSITVPMVLGVRVVTSIGKNAFSDCSGLTSVTIPSSVTSIGKWAFNRCSGLTSVTIPSSVTSIGGQAFSYCGLTSITIPSSVTSIGDMAFSGCSGLVAISVDPANPYYKSVNGLLLTKDGLTLVAGVKGDVTIPSSVTSIGSWAFYDCIGLTSVTIPSSVTDIGWCAFYGCSGLTSVAIPSSVTDIGDYAFSGCGGLTSITIPSSVTSIGDMAFSGCSGLVAISVDPANPYYKSANGLLLTKDGRMLVAGVNGDVTIPSSVTSIGSWAFYDCIGLTSVTIPSSVTSIDWAAFSGCSGLTSVVIPSSVTNIGGYAFSACCGLTSVTIPSSVTSIGFRAFEGCSELTSVTIPSSVTSIGDGAFSDCSGLTSVTIPSSVTSISGYAFEGCSGLTSVTIPSSVTSIGLYAFASCSGLTSVTIPSNVTNIGYRAFENCSGLMSVTIPSSVTSIGYYAFYGCGGLKAVDFEGAPPDGLDSSYIKQDAAIRYNVDYEDEWLPVIKECGFTNATPYVPPKPDGGPYTETVNGIEWTFKVKRGEASVGDGENTAVTNTIAGAVAIPSTLGGRPVSAIDHAAFMNCSNMTSVTIPASVKEIGVAAFVDCDKLADVFFEGNTLSSIGYHAFAGCHWDLIVHVPADWQGRGRTLCGYTVWKAGSSDEEKSVSMSITNTVVQYVLNSAQPEIAVPVSGDTGFVAVITEVTSTGAVSVPIEWRDNYPAFKTLYGNDFGKSLMMKSGKKDGAGNEMFVWQDYVAGTDPTDLDDKFTASITMVGDVPVISYSPELTAEQAALRVYKTWGKKQLKDEWTNLTDADGETLKGYNFFKVTVEMK